MHPAPDSEPEQSPRSGIDWEAFYRDYRKPGYVPGFEIVNKLGGGMFGIVFKARKESIGKDYAIKFLKVDDEVVRDAVVRELKSVDLFAQIDHPNLVSIEDKGEVDGIPFIVMSYAGETTLRRRLDQGSIDADDALRVFTQAVRGVQALHDHSLVHFDLKPANIFLKGDVARVGDYGLSKLVTESRNSLSFGRGTPYYMAPEMLQRRGDSRSDIYSLGVILYEALVGEVPFKGDSEWEVLRKHESERPAIPEHVTGPARRVIEACLQKDPEARPTAREVLQLLSAPASLGESVVLPRNVPAGDRRQTAKPAGFDDERTPPPLPGPKLAVPPPVAQDVESLHDVREVSGPDDDDRLFAETTTLPSTSTPPAGPFGVLIGGLFSLFELAVLCIVVPIRATAQVTGRSLVFLLQLPFRLLGMVFTLAGYVLVALGLFFVLMLFLKASGVPG